MTRSRFRSSIARASALLGVALALSATACLGKKVPLKAIPEGVLTTPGAIYDRDGAFRFDFGRRFTTPYFSDRCVAGKADNFAAARAAGARPVVVLVPGLPQSLYGLLALCRVPEDASGPDARSYRLAVPQEYIDATAEGGASVVYAQTDSMGQYAWQLWLSRSPVLWQ